MKKIFKISPVMLLFFLILIAGCAKHAPQQPSKVAVPPPPVKADPTKTYGAANASVFFLNNKLGWAAVNMESQQPSASVILQTSDGGCNWSQLHSPNTSVIKQLAFADAQHGWALVASDAGNSTTLLAITATVNGGQTWEQQWSKNVPQNCGLPYQMQFLDANNGFALSGGTFVATMNGGASWTQHPTAQHISSFSFRDHLVGWAVGADSVWHTADGGTTWSQQWTMPRTIKNKFSQNCGTVSFTSPTSGWALFQGDQSMFKTAKLILHTKDGGNNWSVASAYPMSNQINSPGNDAPHYIATSFVTASATTALLAASPPTDYPALYCTNDSGKNWKTISDGLSGISGLPQGAWASLNFINSSEGWAAILIHSPIQEDSSTTTSNVALLHTLDGGKTWTTQYPY